MKNYILTMGICFISLLPIEASINRERASDILEDSLSICVHRDTWRGEAECFRREVRMALRILKHTNRDRRGERDRDDCSRIQDEFDKFKCMKEKWHNVECKYKNMYGAYGAGGGCSMHGCWYEGGGCNMHGCWYKGGGCSMHGCTREHKETEQACRYF